MVTQTMLIVVAALASGAARFYHYRQREAESAQQRPQYVQSTPSEVEQRDVTEVV